jgi:hypothetical protein
MSMTRANSAVVIIAWLLAAPAFADDATPDNNGARYTFNKIGDGFVRLDKQTGEVALCNQRTVGWTCQAAPDDRVVLENEIARLRSENAALKGAILSLGLPLPSGVMPEPPAAAGPAAPRAEGNGEVILRLPDDADIARAMAYMGQLWNRFVDALARAEKQALNKS